MFSGERKAETKGPVPPTKILAKLVAAPTPRNPGRGMLEGRSFGVQIEYSTNNPWHIWIDVISKFRLIEKRFGYSVVVAGHPRVDYEKIGNPFEGRRVVEGATQKLVKHSKFVISTASTSVNFPVIYKKPIVFLSINPAKSTFNDNLTASIAEKLGFINFNEEELDTPSFMRKDKNLDENNIQR